MIKIMFLAIFAALVTQHVFVDGESLAPQDAYKCYWAIANASDRVCRNYEQGGFFFFNLHTCSARCRDGQIERRLPPEIICDAYHLDCLGDIGQNDKPLICTGCTPQIYDMLSRWQSG
uniref:Putative wc protein n=1 Tax=Ixodes ricinus TaxID=34613 RepID=A0A0K8RBV8_IXORI